MLRSQFTLDLNQELLVDNFAGGGGASTGIFMALGRHVDHAINHNSKALGMHRINHPQTVHHCEDVYDVDPIKITRGRPVGFGWFSPDCTNFSKAKGGKPRSKRIRGLALVMFRWAAIKTRVMHMENVEEIQTWGPLHHDPSHKKDCICGKPCGLQVKEHIGRTWKAFIAALTTGINDPNHPDIPEMLALVNPEAAVKAGKITPITKEQLLNGFGYKVEWKELRGCDYGSPTIRKRLFMIARRDGRPIVWPEQTHANPAAKRPTHLITDINGKGGERRTKPWHTIAECIDWNLPCPSIFLTRQQAKAARCRRPLASSTLRRIAAGIDRYVLKAEKPFIVSLTHQGGDRIEPIDQPANTITGAHRGEKALCSPVIAGVGGRMGQSPERPVTKPMQTITAKADSALVTAELAPFITEHANASNQRNMPADEPSRTICAQVKGGHMGLVTGSLIGAGGPSYSAKPTPVTAPAHTLTTENHKALAMVHLTKFNTGAVGQDMRQPAPTVVAGSHQPHTHGGAAGPLGIVAASVVKLRGDAETHTPGSPVTEPMHTASAGGTHHALSACYLAQHNTGVIGHAATEPVSSITSKGCQQQVVSAALTAYYGNEAEGQAIDQPLRTATAKPRFSMATTEAVTPALTPEQHAGALRVAAFLRSFGVKFDGDYAMVRGHVIVDIGMRMLSARELFRAQGFPNSYTIEKAWLVDPKTGNINEVTLTKEEQIRMCGNSVNPHVAAALVAANVPEFAVWNKAEKRSVLRPNRSTLMTA